MNFLCREIVWYLREILDEAREQRLELNQINKHLRRMEAKMVTKTELETQIQDIITTVTDGFTVLSDTIGVEIGQVIQAIANGADLTSTSDMLTQLKTSLTEKLEATKKDIQDITAPGSEPTP